MATGQTSSTTVREIAAAPAELPIPAQRLSRRARPTTTELTLLVGGGAGQESSALRYAGPHPIPSCPLRQGLVRWQLVPKSLRLDKLRFLGIRHLRSPNSSAPFCGSLQSLVSLASADIPFPRLRLADSCI